MDSIDDHVKNEMAKADKGTIFFTEDFLTFGTAKAVGKALERLSNKGEITRVARGMYATLEKHKVFGEIRPSTDEIAKAIAKRDKARIIPTGVLALNVLGLSTQVPLNTVYLTDGSARTIKVGKRTIKFKKTSPKNLSVLGEISSLVIQALKEIGKENVTANEIHIVLKHLKKEKTKHLEHDINLAPEWIRVIMRKALNDKKNG